MTRGYYVRMAKHTITQTMPRDSTGNLVFDAKDLGKIGMESP